MKPLGLVLVFAFSLSLLAAGLALAADDTTVKAATNQVDSGSGKVGEGVDLQEAGKATEPPAKTAWGSVKSFFTDPFTGDNRDPRFRFNIAR
jgi:hypothetical protein